jgi:hypothetical protein
VDLGLTRQPKRVQTGGVNDPPVVDRGEPRPTPSPGRAFVAILVGVLLAAGVLGQVTGSDTPRAQPPRTPQVRSLPVEPTPGANFAGEIDLANVPGRQDTLRLCRAPVGGLILSGHPRAPGWTVENWECGALKGPWSMVVRGPGGHLGFHSAVVTFPVSSQLAGAPVKQPQAGRWDVRGQVLVWPLAGSHAQIVGDLGQARMADLAQRVTVKAGRPQLSAPAGFTVSAAMTYRAPVIHEMRYSAVELGQVGTFGTSLVYTGAMSGGTFESDAFRAHAKPAGLVRGRPAIGYVIPGRQAALAWEPSPGRVLYIGISGSPITTNALEALRDLAENGRELTAAQWQTKDRLATVNSSG